MLKEYIKDKKMNIKQLSDRSGVGYNYVYKIVNNLNDGNARIEVTEKNEKILEVLFNAGFINNYEIAGDNKHYKKIKSKENAVNIKSDETVVN